MNTGNRAAWRRLRLFRRKGRVEFRDLHVVGPVLLTDANGTIYRLAHAGVWDPPEGSDRVGVYYEDEDLPAGAVSLYRVEIERA